MATTGSGRSRSGGDRVPRMWSHAATDEVLIPEPALPAQVLHLWHHTRAIGAERALALAVLSQAVTDVQRYRATRLPHHRPQHDEALAWIASPARDWPFSFANLCDAFNLEVDEARAALLATTPAAARQAA